jgi:hypothetical protein
MAGDHRAVPSGRQEPIGTTSLDWLHKSTSERDDVRGVARGGSCARRFLVNSENLAGIRVTKGDAGQLRGKGIEPEGCYPTRLSTILHHGRALELKRKIGRLTPLDWERLVADAASRRQGTGKQSVSSLPYTVEPWLKAQPGVESLTAAGANYDLCAYAVLRLVKIAAADARAARPQKARSRSRRRTPDAPELTPRAGWAAVHEFAPRPSSRRARGRPSTAVIARVLSGLSWHCRQQTRSPHWEDIANLVLAIRTASLPLFALTGGGTTTLAEQARDLTRKLPGGMSRGSMDCRLLFRGLNHLRKRISSRKTYS